MSLRAKWDTYRQDQHPFNRPRRTGQHSLEIIGGKGSGEFKIDFDTGFEIIDGGSPKDLWPVIQPRSCRFKMFIENDLHLNFIKGIADSREVSEYIVIYKRGTRTAFVGAILTEAVTLIQGPYFMVDGIRKIKGFATITAIDGLTFLKDAIAEPIFQDRRVPLIKYVAFALNNMPTWPYVVANPILVQSSWEPDTGTKNFMLNQTIDGDALLLLKERLGGAERRFSSWDVLESICITFNMRLRAAYGYYFFQQLEDTEAPAYLFNKNGDPQGSSRLTTRFQDAETDDLTLLDPHVQSFTPPIKSSKVVYNFKFNPNLVDGNKYRIVTYNDSCYDFISEVNYQGAVTRLRVIGSLEYTPNIGPSGLDDGEYMPIFRMQIQVGDHYFVNTLDNFYYFEPRFGKEEWTTEPGYYYFAGPGPISMPDENEKKFFLPIYFSTARLPAAVGPGDGLDGEDLSVCIGQAAYDYEDNAMDTVQLWFETILDDLDITLIDVENQVVEKTSLETVITYPGQNTKKIEREIFFSSGPNSGSENRITDDSIPPISTVNWTVPGQGTDKHYIQLAKSLASRGQTAQTWMQTEVEGPYQDLVPLRACGATWVWWTGSYVVDQHQELHRGEFLQVALEPVDVEYELDDAFRVLERPPKPTEPIGGRPDTVEIEVTGITGDRINADTYKIPMPDTTGWPADAIRDAVQYNAGGNIQRYADPPTIQNQFAWDNATRDFVLSENSQRNVWHIFRIFF